ncbi:MAG TPA: hypothetical protein VHO48_01425, partial [Anaerolineaceae bacterium]|nr:hypothetical protein [Anaerolineaceae bacterium]
MDGQSPFSRFFTRRSMLGLLGLESFAILGLILALLSANSPQRQQPPTPAGAASSFPTIVPSFTPAVTVDPTQTQVTPTAPITTHAETGNWLALSMNDGGYAHLFAFQPQSLPLTRLTANPWDDITPAVNADGTKIAYSSRQNGFWDLYILDLKSGAQTRLTDTPEYDAAPTWSPDGLWIAYETYAGDDLEIAVRSVANPADAPLMLTDDPAADHSPAWAPDGRHVAFVSDRGGEDDVWLASLDQTDQRFTNLSDDPRLAQAHPTWSPDGSKLAWASTGAGYTFIDLWDSAQPAAQPVRLGEGLWPAWSPLADTLVTSIDEANQAYLNGYTRDGLLAFPSIRLPGNLYGFSWASTDFPVSLPANLQAASAYTPAPLWTDLPDPAENPTARSQVVALDGIEAPHPYLLDRVTPSFLALRSRLIVDAGWDVFAALDSAYLPLTDALPPRLRSRLGLHRPFLLDQLDHAERRLDQHRPRIYWRAALLARVCARILSRRLARRPAPQPFLGFERAQRRRPGNLRPGRR